MAEHPVERQSLSIVIPVRDGADHLHRCLQALAASTRAPDEVIVVDDSSTDNSSEQARAAGARVVALSGGPCGPAAARNRGAAETHGDVLVFLDADVAVHPETLARIEKYLTDQPQIAALFGSYDAQPPGRGWVSLYKNLLHHYTHQHARRETAAFWAGCGAIRRDVFDALGGFNEGYARPSIEDIELGTRLRRSGSRVWLCPDVQVTHLKEWTLSTLFRSDIRDRALPWSRLILQERDLPSDLNLDVRNRLSAVQVWFAILLLLLGPWLPWSLVGAVAALAGLVILNAGLYRLFARQGGIAFAVGASGLHALYLLYSSAVFAGVIVAHQLRRFGRTRTLLVAMGLFQVLFLVAIWLSGAASDRNKVMHVLLYAAIVGIVFVMTPPRLVTWLRRSTAHLARNERRTVFSLGLFVVFVGLVYATRQRIVFDEESTFAAAKILATRGMSSFFAQYGSIGWLGAQHPPLVPLIYGFAMYVLGSDLLVARSVSLMFTLGTLFVTYHLAVKLYDRETGLRAALLLLTFTYVFRTGTAATIDMPLTFFFALALFLTLRLMESPSYKQSIVLGISIGVGLLVKYPMALFYPVLIGCALIGRSLRRLVLYLGLAALISLSILTLWLALAANIGVLWTQGRVVMRYAQIVTMSTNGWKWVLEALVARLPSAVGAYNVPIVAVGMLLAMWRRNRSESILLLWVESVSLVLLITLPDPRYFVPIFPGLAIVSAHGLSRISDAAGQIVLLALVYWVSMLYLFVDWQRTVPLFLR